MCEIRNPEENYTHSLGFGLRLGLDLGLGQFSLGAIFLEPQNSFVNIGENGHKFITE